MEYFPMKAFKYGLHEAVCWKLGGGGTQKQTTEVTLTPEQKQVQEAALPWITQFAQQGVSAPGFSQVAGFDPLQTQGQNLALSAAGGGQQQIADLGLNIANTLGPDVLKPETNPALQGTIDAAVRPIYQNLTQNTLPAIRGEAATLGQFGGSRQGVAEGLAAQGASQAAGDTASKVANTNYQAGLDALTRNLTLLPQTSATQLTPALTTSGVGDVRQALAQALLGEQGANFSFEQLAPLLVGKELAGISAGLPGGKTTTTATTPQPSPLMQALGLGATALGTFFGGPAGGAAAGSLFGSLGNTLSPSAIGPGWNTQSYAAGLPWAPGF